MRYVVNMLHMLSYGQQGGWGGGREKHVLCGAARFSQKITLRCAKKNNSLLKDMLYIALSPDQPPQSDLLHPPQQMVLALDMSYLLAFSHLTPTDQTIIFPMKFLRAFTHFTLTFIPIFLVHLFHSVTVLFFPFSYASEATSQVELSSLYPIFYWPTTSYSFESVTISCCSWGGTGKSGTYLTGARARSIKKRAFYLLHFELGKN